MNEKIKTQLSLIVNFLLFFGLGLLILNMPVKSLKLFHIVVSVAIIIVGFISIIFSAIKKKNIWSILTSITTLLVGIFFYFNPTRMLSLFPIIFGLYMLTNSIIKFTIYAIYKYKGFQGFVMMLLASIFDFIFATIMILSPSDNISTLTIITSIYILGFSFMYLYEFFKDLFPKFFSNKRKIRLTLPIIFSVFIPYTAYTKINKFLNKYNTPVKIRNKNVSGEVDLEVYIHVKDTNIGKFGHADLAFDGKVYSYGCYDENSKKLFELIGDGTLFIIDNPDDYIKFCTKHSNKTIFSFGVTLTKRQKENVSKEIEKIKSYTYKWNCDQELDLNHKYDDYASILYRYTKAHFYKFHKSNYKLYYLFWTNCVKLVDKVLGASGSDIIKLNGVITPGAYYAFLNNEFKRKNSNIITKNIYTSTDDKPIEELIKIKKKKKN